MNHLLESISQAVEQQNWYCALSLALALPDICGWLETLNPKSGERYIDWFERYVGPAYIREVGPLHCKHVFLSGRDCYALRCAFLHQGREDISSQKVQETLTRFRFSAPPASGLIHRNQINSQLQLQVDIFCYEMIAGARKWLADVEKNQDVIKRMEDLLRIYNPKTDRIL